MLQMSVSRAKNLFFDRAFVIERVDAATRKVLSRGGAILMRSATQSDDRRLAGVCLLNPWVRTPQGVTSWQAFDKILNEANVVITPGSDLMFDLKKLLSA